MLDVRGGCKPCAPHHSVHSSGCSALEIMRPVFSSSAGSRLRCLRRNSALSYPPDAGHFAMLDTPNLVAERIEGFLASVG
jgi:pimeloyl-ACP methyl ester carboxylesterase